MKRLLYGNFVVILMADILLVAFAWYFAYLLRFNFDIPVRTRGLFIWIHPLPISTQTLLGKN
jgi:hypothetical protein